MISKIMFWVVVLISSIFTMFWILVYFLYDDVRVYRRRITNYPLISIAVPAYNEEKTIYKTLLSLKRLKYPMDKKEIIVINDGSTDNTLEEVKRFKKENPEVMLKIINNKKNIGKGRSLNKALSLSKGEFFVVMDADTFINRNALLSMIGLYEGNKTRYDKIGGIISHIKVMRSNTLIEKFQRFEYIYGQFMRNLMSRVGILYITPGAFSLYSKKIIEDLGGFDENTLTEDFEIALRLKYNGYEILFDRDTISYTDIPSTFRKYLRQRLRWSIGFIENTGKYFMKFIKKRDLSLFGHVFYPISLFSLFILILYVLKNLYYFFKSLFYNIQTYYYVRKIYFWDMQPLREFILSLNYDLLIPITLIIFTSLIIYYLSFKHGREKVKQNFLFVIYFLSYTTLYLFIWIYSLIYYYAKYKRDRALKW